jgi:hypothetical protein
MEEAAALFRQAVGTGMASSDPREIVPAAYDGLVDSLFVTPGQHWGRFEPETRAVDVHPQFSEANEDLLDFAAVHTFLNGGSVYLRGEALMPEQSGLAALFRC